MSDHSQSILTAALALPAEERAWLIDQLEESLPADDGAIDPELLAELERRAAEAERDPSVLIPWSDVQRMT